MNGLFTAFLLDLWIGDPVYSWHPARLIGKSIKHAERLLRRRVKNLYVGGLFLAVILPASIFALMSWVLHMCFLIHPWLAWIVNTLVIYTTISVHDLRKEAVQIYSDLKNSDIEQARKDLSRIVGRDTKNLDETEITRATVETVAESTVDGVIAPIFFAALGGAPLALAYKAVNTLDSMVGHKNERYKEFGYFSAKIDDWVNWIPARLSLIFICLASILTRSNMKSALAAGFQELKVINSISNLPEAAFAGALQIQLGGTNSYQGRVEEKKFLGFKQRIIKSQLIPESITLMVYSSWVTLSFCLMIHYFIF